MAYRSFFRLPVVFSLLVLLGSCCANNVCNCDDANADAVALKFATSGVTPGSRAFTAADLDTLVLVRVPLPFSASSKAETVRLFRTAAQANDDLLLNNSTPFTQVGTARLSRYRYEVQYLAHPTRAGTPTTVLVIDSVQLRGAFAGDGCCTCYTNTRKTVFAKVPRRAGAAPDSSVVVDLKRQDRILLTK